MGEVVAREKKTVGEKGKGGRRNQLTYTRGSEVTWSGKTIYYMFLCMKWKARRGLLGKKGGHRTTPGAIDLLLRERPSLI